MKNFLLGAYITSWRRIRSMPPRHGASWRNANESSVRRHLWNTVRHRHLSPRRLEERDGGLADIVLEKASVVGAFVAESVHEDGERERRAAVDGDVSGKRRYSVESAGLCPDPTRGRSVHHAPADGSVHPTYRKGCDEVGSPAEIPVANRQQAHDLARAEPVGGVQAGAVAIVEAFRGRSDRVDQPAAHRREAVVPAGGSGLVAALLGADRLEQHLGHVVV